jgi:hypothetical protein
VSGLPASPVERWQSRFDACILATVVIALLGVGLQVAAHHGPWHGVGVGLAALSWLVFGVDAAVMLSISPDRVRWARGHVFDLGLLVLTFPLWPLLGQRLLLLELLPALTVLEAAKLAKLLKVVRVLRRRPAEGGARFVAAGVIGAAGLLAAAVLLR